MTYIIIISLCFSHETGGKFYRVSAYFSSKIFCDVIPMRIIPSLVYSAVVYYMAGKTLVFSKMHPENVIKQIRANVLNIGQLVKSFA